MLPYIVHDPRFTRLVIGHANLEKLANGCRWAEGPAYFRGGNFLIFSVVGGGQPSQRFPRTIEQFKRQYA